MTTFGCAVAPPAPRGLMLLAMASRLVEIGHGQQVEIGHG